MGRTAFIRSFGVVPVVRGAIVAALCITMSAVIRECSSWEQYVEQYNRQFFQKRLGFDPMITIYRDDQNVDRIASDSCTVYCHGWGENQTAVNLRRRWSLLPGTVVGFNFPDAVSSPNEIRAVACKSSFAQENDCRTLTAVLKLLDEADCYAIHLVGYSRGGGTVANTIARLKQYEKYRKFFKKLGISHAQAESILTRIHRGTVVLDCPLLSMQIILRYHFPNPVEYFMWSYICTPCATHFKYAAWKDQAIDAAPYLKDFNLLVHFQNRDNVVTNLLDAAFYRTIQAPTTHVLFADDGGHYHKGQTLAPALHAFRKMYGGPHYNDTGFLEAGAHILTDSQPREEETEQYFKQYLV